MDKPPLPTFIPIDEKINTIEEQIKIQYYNIFLNPLNTEILNPLKTPYTLSDVEYTYNNIILVKKDYETHNQYKKRIINSIFFSCFVDNILDVIAFLTKNLNITNNIYLTLIGGIATKIYNIEHYTNDIDIKIYPKNKEVYDVLFNEEGIINFMDDYIKLYFKYVDKEKKLMFYLQMLNEITSLRNNSTFKEIENDLLKNISKNKIKILFNKTENDVYKLTFEIPDYLKIKLVDISFFNIEDKKFQKIQNDIYNTKDLIYYNISNTTIKGNNGYFFIESYYHILKEKELLLNDINENTNKYNDIDIDFLKNKFENSYNKLKNKATRRVYIGGNKV